MSQILTNSFTLSPKPSAISLKLFHIVSMTSVLAVALPRTQVYTGTRRHEQHNEQRGYTNVHTHNVWNHVSC